ncbi:MAG TPA: pyridoxamine 5'-phosphate oxidase [Bryobacteraceae bacterium]
MDLASLRLEYSAQSLDESEVDRDPVRQFSYWFDQAVAAGLREPNAMTLATATLQGEPSARIVLLKEFGERGFVFYTNYESVKGRELQENPRAALVFFWSELERQVRLRGGIEKVTREESEAYFRVRPVKSRFGAAASPQSRIVPGRKWLEDQVTALEGEFGESGPERPENWGGYRLKPESIEFWQGRKSRLHDRVLYTQTDTGGVWNIVRLAP